VLSRRSHFQEQRTSRYEDAITNLETARRYGLAGFGFWPVHLTRMYPYGEADVIIVLIWEQCGTAREASPTEFSSAIEAAAHAAAFTPKSRAIEITGICTNCRREKEGQQTI